MPDRTVIVGASLAGLRTAESLRQGGYRGTLTIVGDEPHRPYDRPPLSKHVLTGKIEPEATALPLDETLDLNWRLGVRAGAVDPDRGVVHLDDGTEVPFDRLVIATGARPRILPGVPPGPGVHYLRTLDDSVALRDDLRRSEAVVVIGAGFIGLEVASSAAQLGVPVTVVEALPVPLERAVGEEAGRSIMEWHRAKGIEIRAGVGVASIQRSTPGGGAPHGPATAPGRPEAVLLADGSRVPADTVVVGIGVVPATGWLASSGFDIDDGVVCDERLRVLRSGRPSAQVVAVGDVARWRHPAYERTVRVEHWTNATESAEAAAATLLSGEAAPPYAPTPYFWSDQHGIKLQFVGRAAAGDETAMIEGGFDQDRFVMAYGREGRLVAALGMRRPARIMALQRRIAEGAAFPPD